MGIGLVETVPDATLDPWVESHHIAGLCPWSSYIRETGEEFRMTPLDIRTKEEWLDLQENFSQDIKMTACLTDTKGKQFFCCGERYPMCKRVRSDEKALTFICSQTNAAMTAVVSKTLKPEIDLCEAGMIRVVVPVLKDGTMIGMVTACGLVPNDDEVDVYLLAKELQMPEEEVEALAKATPSAMRAQSANTPTSCMK